MMTGGRVLPSARQSVHTGRMSQTSIERLRDYLAQLPPQAQALLMREFERAIERGEDATVANFVLEQLRKVVRGTDEEARPRTDDPARLLFRPLEPFLVEGNAPVRPGQIRRASLLPVWQWLIRDGAPEQVREFEAALARDARNRNRVRARSGGPQIPARRGGCDLQDRHAGARRRQAARAGPRRPARRDRGSAADRLGFAGPRSAGHLSTAGFPATCGCSADSQIASVSASLNVPALQTPQMLPFALSLVMQRLTAPWQIIRLAIKMAASDDEIRVAATPYGIAVTIALHDLSCLAAACARISSAAISTTSPSISRSFMTACAACGPNSISATIRPGASN